MSRFYGKRPAVEPVVVVVPLPAAVEPVITVTLPHVEEDFDITVDPHLIEEEIFPDETPENDS